MASIQPRFGYPGNRKSYTCGAAVVGGQLVMRASGTNLVTPAGALSAIVEGVALDDVPAVRTFVNGPQVGDGNELTVYWGGEVPVTYAASATEGQRLVAAANGQVTPYISGTHDASLIVGRCVVATASAAVGFACINPVGG
jgi:hypothetical protein